jgi:hypothetical protein
MFSRKIAQHQHGTPSTTAPAPAAPGTAQHITLVLKHNWTAAITTLDLPDYIPGTDTGVRTPFTVIDIITW